MSKLHLRFLFGGGNIKVFLHRLSGPADAAFKLDPSGNGLWEDMRKSTKAQVKEPEVVVSNALPVQSVAQEETVEKFYTSRLGINRDGCCTLCFRILYTAIGLITSLESIAVIVVAVTSALATKIYSDEQSGRLVAMVMLAVTAAITISVTIYAVVGAIRKQRGPVRTASVVLIVIVVIQAIILGVSVGVTTDDEVKLGRSLSESFKLARDDNPRHVKIWARTQHDLKCCGVYSAEDYRSPNFPTYFAPNVPISCCPTYDPERSELVQEKERESCKAKKEFYDIGCRNLIIDVFKETSKSVLAVTVLVIILEVWCIIIGSILSIYKLKSKRNTGDLETIPPEIVSTEITSKKKSKS
ncbi:uncharacterized protein [Battus philenor]|uniref:uncharacterized protein n=1 Tax=Battus philenor TaxID=42288 RepID=UPI0035CF9627